MKRQPEPLANEVGGSFDALLGDLGQRLVGAGSHGRNGQGEVHHGHRDRLLAAGDHPEGVQGATEDTVADAEIANVLEQDFGKCRGIEKRNVLLAHCTSPAARVHLLSDDDTGTEPVESFRHCGASVSRNSSKLQNIYCDCDQAHLVDPDNDVCGYAKWRR